MKTNKSIFASLLIATLSLQSFAAVTPPPSTLALQAAAMAEQATALAQQAVLASQAAAAQDAAQRQASQQSSLPQTYAVPQTGVAPQTAVRPQAGVTPQFNVTQAAPAAIPPQAAIVPQSATIPQAATFPQVASVPQAAMFPQASVLPQTVPLVNTSSIPVQAPQTGAVSAPVSPLQLLQCNCPADKTPVMFAGLCICGSCAKVSDGVTVYNKQCPDSKFTEFNAGLTEKCKEIENTEDCEFFKKSPGNLTDDYKRCRDMLDSIQDDCENEVGCCSTMKVPGAVEAED
ncbi:hypothetical protein EDC94DRAFT_627139 [Helicostylum pulchrum]|nr:hypothetical protein EDC94DRAFT_627139 [Helicostylum pulchrum]